MVLLSHLYMKAKVLVTQLCLTVCNPMDSSLEDYSVHGFLQARIVEWVAIPFSRGSSWTRNQTWVSCTAGRFFTIWATREAHPFMTTGKSITLTLKTFVGKVMSLLFNMLSKDCHRFSSEEQAYFNFMAEIYVHSNLGVQENTSCQCFHFFPFYLPWSEGTGCHDLSFLMLSFKSAYSCSSFT